MDGRERQTDRSSQTKTVIRNVASTRRTQPFKGARITKNLTLPFSGQERFPTPHYIMEITIYRVLSGFYY